MSNVKQNLKATLDTWLGIGIEHYLCFWGNLVRYSSISICLAFIKKKKKTTVRYDYIYCLKIEKCLLFHITLSFILLCCKSRPLRQYSFVMWMMPCYLDGMKAGRTFVTGNTNKHGGAWTRHTWNVFSSGYQVTYIRILDFGHITILILS